MWQRRFFSGCLLFVFSLNFWACDSSLTIKEQDRFFDLKGFFEAEASRLSGLGKVRKTTKIDGLEETKDLAIDIAAELKIFAGSDINRVAWLDSYQVDSLRGEDNSLRKLSYLALEEDLRTQHLQIYFSKNAVDSITILNKTSTAIADSQQRIRYVPQVGYAIQSEQDISFASKHALEVQVAFLD
ncbi:MAG: hypothetical protein AB8G15_13815 [Saprospiraceae bacterium]